MKVTLIKQFKNHPIGSVLDVSSGVYNYLVSRKCVEKIKAPTKREAFGRSKALKEPPAHKMITEAETKEASVEAEKDKEAPIAEKEQKKKKR